MINQGQKAGLGPKAVTAVSRHRNHSTLEAYERVDSNTLDTVIKLGQDTTSDIVRPVPQQDNFILPTTKPIVTTTIIPQKQQQNIHRPRGA
jgi:hypothetical protein